MIRLLTEILNIDTQNPPGNERILADYILRYLSGCPCEAFVQETGNGRANVIARIRARALMRALAPRLWPCRAAPYDLGDSEFSHIFTYGSSV